MASAACSCSTRARERARRLLDPGTFRELLGPFDGWYICPHAPDEDCECRKPKPKLVFDAVREWQIDPSEIVVVGDKTSDVDVARNAGSRGMLIDSTHSLADAISIILREGVGFT